MCQFKGFRVKQKYMNMNGDYVKEDHFTFFPKQILVCCAPLHWQSSDDVPFGCSEWSFFFKPQVIGFIEVFPDPPEFPPIAFVRLDITNV